MPKTAGKSRIRADEGGARRMIVLPDQPAPTVMAGGIGSVNTSQYALGDSDMPQLTSTDGKPPYRVPLMSEIVKIKPCGFNAVSTFSGCGGSSLGYRMAGFKVLWASEFVPAARDSYRANMATGTVLDERDIREVTPESVLAAIKMRPGQLDLLDGSPPCASFSTAGKRQKGWGEVKKYSDVKQRTDDLFFEFVRLLEGLKPKTFVAENVSGLVKGTAKGYFLMILSALKTAGYRVSCKVLDAQWLGVPQQRQRTIFIGVREDLTDAAGNPIMPAHPTPLPYRYSVREAIPWISGTSKDVPSGGDYDKQTRKGRSVEQPAPTIIGTAQARNTPFVNEVSENTFGEHRTYQDRPGPSIRARKPGHLKITSEGPDGVKMEVSLDGPSPTVRAGSKNRARTDQFIVEAESSMNGLATGAEWDAMNAPGGSSEQSEKYFQLVKAAPSEPSPTVTAAGGNAGLASVCHPTERRKFSIAELRRICAFPDDFVLTGTYAQQWERLGRAVPPLMMRAVAEVVRDQILKRIRK